MSHGLKYAQWIDSCPNNHTYKDANKQCLQVVYDFLFKVSSKDPLYKQSREYFDRLNQPLADEVKNPAIMLKEFRRLRKILKGIQLNFNDDPVTFVGSSHSTVSITYKSWRGERVTALDQYARFLCGLDSKFALQADHIRQVYRPHIEKARNNRQPYEISVREDLIVLDGSLSQVVNVLTCKKSLQCLGASNFKKIDGVTSLHFG